MSENRRKFARQLVVCFTLQTLFASFTVIAACLSGAGSAQAAKASRTLSSKEGRAVVEAARKHRKKIQGTLDCSFLVHAVYRSAGHSYPYAPSVTIFRGIPEFRRVKKPQPGDLVVWRGHVGIVIDPAERTFYSWLSDGPGDARYDSRYWREHGPMRFYRYVQGERKTLASAAH